MTAKGRSIEDHKKLSMPISYRLLDSNRLYDARNVFDNKGVTETRNGIKRYNSTSLGGTPLSTSCFKTSAGVRYKLVKVGTVLYAVNSSGAHTSVKTGLTSTTKHRGVTLDDRHIIAIESDGLFSWNGTTFTQLGQAAPSTVTAVNAAGGSLIDTNLYQVSITFYSSTIGFESNAFTTASVTVAVATGLRIALSAIPATASNALMDKVRIYLKNVTAGSSRLLSAEISLGTTTHNIDTFPTSTLVVPTTNAPPISGGGKYLTIFGKCIAYTGNASFKNDVFISEEYVPDAYDDTITSKGLAIPGQGEITGIASGLYNNSFIDPFLVVFKKTSTTVYSELNGVAVQTTIDNHVGCVSHDTIRVRNGVVWFMSENGWYGVENGALIKKNGTAVSLGGGEIDDIFSRDGWVSQLNVSQYSNFFSVYYSTLGHYLTFVAEGGNSSFYKAYVYEERIGGFRVYEFKTPFTSACEGEDDSGNQCIFLSDTNGYLFTLSVKNELHDEDKDAASQTIPVFCYLPFVIPGDDSISYNFGTLVIKALNSTNAVTVKAFPSFSLFTSETTSFDFTNSTSGFVLDMSQLDIDVLGDERVPVAYKALIKRTGETMIIGFFQDILDANIGLVSSQLTYTKNGNRNL
jgi:hypothetical protein